jgi:competence protein ComEA
MFKKILATAAMLFAVASSWAAVEANKATDAELDGLKGIGPALSKRIVDARKQGEFKDWADFMGRVKGVKEKSATKLSAEGLTINGQAFAAAAPAAKAAKVEKGDAKDTKKATAKP